MTKRIAAALTAGLFLAALAPAQQVKSKKESEALLAINAATTPDDRIAAIENLLTRFADTQFKVIVLEMAAETARMKGDVETTVIYCERALEADPKSLSALAILSKITAERTREFDLDKEEKLTKAEGYARKCIELAPTAKDPITQRPAADWETMKKDLAAQAHEALGASAALRKKYDAAITEYKTALEGTPVVDPATQIRLGIVYTAAGQYDDAVAILDKAMTSDNATIKQIAAQEKVKAATLRAQKKAAAPKP